jgi:hypothetical protein
MPTSSLEADPFGRGRRRRLFALGAIAAALGLAVAATAAISVKPAKTALVEGPAPASLQGTGSPSATAATLAVVERPAADAPALSAPTFAPAPSLAVAPGAIDPVRPRVAWAPGHGPGGRGRGARLGLAPGLASAGHPGVAGTAGPPPATDVATTEPAEESAPSAPPSSPPPAVTPSSPSPALTASSSSGAEPSVAPGTISQAAVRATVRAHSEDIQRCFDRGQMDQMFMTARITMTATVAPDGHPTAVATSADHEGTARLQACIRDSVQQWSFPQPTGGVPGHVSYTFVFE